MDDLGLGLRPSDWFWAPWRDPAPLDRGEPAPFELAAALTTLDRAYEGLGRGALPRWHQAELPAALDPEAAAFWYAAMTAPSAVQRDRRALRRHLSEARGRDVDWEAAARDLLTGRGPFAERPRRPGQVPAQPEVVLPLAAALGPVPLLAALVERPGRGLRSATLLVGFRHHLLPYLDRAERAALGQRVAAKLRRRRWPEDAAELPPAPWILAGYLGLEEHLLPLVTSWADDRYRGPRGAELELFHQPQLALFGLRDPARVEAEARRLGLLLRTQDHVRAWLAHTETGALDWVERSLEAAEREEAEVLVEAFLGVARAEAAPVMLALAGGRRVAGAARRWLRAHPELAARGLAAAAAGRGRRAEAAASWLTRELREGPGRTALDAALSELPAASAQRVRRVVAERPEANAPAAWEAPPAWWRDAVPPARGRAPDWLDLGGLPPVVVEDEGATRRLPAAQVVELVRALKKCRADAAPPPLVAALRERARPESLDAFGWTLFAAWQDEGAPSSERWTLAALAHLGGDATVLRLAPLVRRWPSERQHARAVTGLRVLAAIGTDAALQEVSALARGTRAKALRARAQACLRAAAARRGLGLEALEDRVVPTCGLEGGARTFDYGARSFAAFLSPDRRLVVRDATGRLRKAPPAPGARDDPGRAGPAYAAWKAFRKQVHGVLAAQARRLEQAMVAGRRWSPADLRTHVVDHPLVGHLARSLLWASFAPQSAPRPFRLAPDGAPLDLPGQPLDLGDLPTGLVHPLHLEPDERAAWDEVLLEADAVPPFPQLEREVFTPTPAERRARVLRRLDDLAFRPLALVGALDALGWTRGDADEAGFVARHWRAFPGAGVTAVLSYPGVPMGFDPWEDQTVEGCAFVAGTGDPGQGPTATLRIGDVDPVALSEVLRDLEHLARRGV